MKRIHTYESFLNEAKPLFSATENKIMDLQQELKDLKSDLKQAWTDMENDPDIEPEGGKIADEWGGKLEDLQKQIEMIEAKIEKLENPTKKKAKTYEEITPVGIAKKSLLNNIVDIKKSIKSWPDRTVQQQAEIYKKRYGMKAELADIATALGEIQTENKI